MKDILSELDLVLAFLGLASSFSVFIVYSIFAGRVVSALFLFIGLSCLTYLLMRRHNLEESAFGIDRPFNLRSAVILDLIFALILIPGLFSAIAPFFKSQAYLIFLWAEILLTMTEIYLFIPTEKMNVDVVMKVLIISAVLRCVPYLSFPGPIGVDPWWHTFFIKLISENCRIPSGFGYSAFPVHHLEVAMLTSISSISSLKVAQLLSVSLFEVISLIAVFGIGKLILGPKSSLLAALIVGVSDWHIQWGTYPIPTSLGLGFFTLVVFLVLQNRYRHQLVVVILLLATIILTHTISSFILLLTLGLMFMAPKFYRFFFKEAPSRSISIFLIIFFGIALLSYWSYASSFFTERILSLDRTLSGLEAPTWVTVPPPSPFLDYWSWNQFQMEVDNMGMYLLYWLGILGSLMWLSRHNSKSTTFCLILTASILFATYYGSVFLKTRILVPERWLAFLYVLLAAPAVKGIQMLSGLMRNKVAGFAVAVTIVLLLSILMTTDTTANLGSSILSRGPKFALSMSEIYASKFLYARYRGRILTDDYYAICFTFEANQEPVTRLQLISGMGELVQDGLTAIRKSSYSNPTVISIGDKGEALAMLTDNLRNELDNSENKIFDNGGVVAWLSLRS